MLSIREFSRLFGLSVPSSSSVH